MYKTEELDNHGRIRDMQQCTNVPLIRSNINNTTNNPSYPASKAASKSSTTSVLRSWRRPDPHETPKQSKDASLHGKYVSKHLEPAGSETDKQMNLNTNYCANSDNSNSSSVQSDYSVYGSQLSPIVPQSTARPYVDSAKYFPHVQYAEGAGAYSRASPVLSTTQSKDIRQSGSGTAKYCSPTNHPYFQQDGAAQPETHFRSPLYPSQEIPPMAHKASQNKLMRDYSYTNFISKDQRLARDYNFPIQKPPNIDSKTNSQAPTDDPRYCLPKTSAYIQDNSVSPHNCGTSPYSYTANNQIDSRISTQEAKASVYRNYPGQNGTEVVDSRMNTAVQNYGIPKPNIDHLNQNNNSYCMEKTSCVAQEQQKQSMDRFSYSQNCLVQKPGMVSPQDAKYSRDCNISHASKKSSPPFPILEQRLNQQEPNFGADYSSQSYMYHKFSSVMMPRTSPTIKSNREGTGINYGGYQKLPTQEVMLPPSYAFPGKYFSPVQNPDWKREFEQNLYLSQMSQMHARLPQNMINRMSDQPRDLSYIDQNRVLQKSRAHFSESYPMDPGQYAAKQNSPISRKTTKITYSTPEERLHTENEYARTYGTVLKQTEYSQPSILQLGKESNYDPKLSRDYLMQQAYRTEATQEPQHFMSSPTLTGHNSRNPAAYQHFPRQENFKANELPPRNISPRRTFQENMPVTVIPSQHIGLPKESPTQYPDYLNPQIYPGYLPRDPINSKPSLCQYIDQTVKYSNISGPRSYSQQRFLSGYPESQNFSPKHPDSNDKMNYYLDRAHYNINMQEKLVQNSDRNFAEVDYQNIPGAYRSYGTSKDDSAEYAKKDSDLGKSLKEFLESWEDDEEIVANLPDLVLCNNISSEKPRHVTFADPISKETIIPSCKPTRENQSDDALYILDSTNISTEALPQYLHIQQIDRLPDNIKGYYKTSSPESTEDEKDDIPEVPTTMNQEQSSPQNYSMVSKVEDTQLEQSSPKNYSTKTCPDDGQALNLSTNRIKEDEEFLTEEYQATSDDDSVKVQTDHTEKHSQEASISELPITDIKQTDSKTNVTENETKKIYIPEETLVVRHLKEGENCCIVVALNETENLAFQNAYNLNASTSDNNQRVCETKTNEDIEEKCTKQDDIATNNIETEPRQEPVTEKPVAASVIVPNMFLDCLDDKFTHSNFESTTIPDHIFPEDSLDIPEVKLEEIVELPIENLTAGIPNNVDTAASLIKEQIEDTSTKSNVVDLKEESSTEIHNHVDNSASINKDLKATSCKCTGNDIKKEENTILKVEDNTEVIEKTENYDKIVETVSEVKEIDISKTEDYNTYSIVTLDEESALQSGHQSDSESGKEELIVETIVTKPFIKNKSDVFQDSSDTNEPNFKELKNFKKIDSPLVEHFDKRAYLPSVDTVTGEAEDIITNESNSVNNNKQLNINTTKSDISFGIENIHLETQDHSTTFQETHITESSNGIENSNAETTTKNLSDECAEIKEESDNSNSCFSDSTIILSTDPDSIDVNTNINSNESLPETESTNSDENSSVFQNETTRPEVDLEELVDCDSISDSNFTLVDDTEVDPENNIIQDESSQEKHVLATKDIVSIPELEESDQITSLLPSEIEEGTGIDTLESEMEVIHDEITPFEFEDLQLNSITATPSLNISDAEISEPVTEEIIPVADTPVPEDNTVEALEEVTQCESVQVNEEVFEVPEVISDAFEVDSKVICDAFEVTHGVIFDASEVVPEVIDDISDVICVASEVYSELPDAIEIKETVVNDLEDHTLLNENTAEVNSESVVCYDENEGKVVIDTEENLEKNVPTGEIQIKDTTSEEVVVETEKSLSSEILKEVSAIGSEEILSPKGTDDWVQNEEIIIVTECKEDLKQNDFALDEKKKAVFATRKRKLEIFKQTMLSAKKEKNSEVFNLTDDLPLNLKKNIHPVRVEEKELFINPENPLFSSKSTELSLFDGTLSRKRRLSFDEFSNFNIEFKAQKRRYSTMDAVRMAKKPIINLDEISQNITEELQKISKTEMIQYKEEHVTDKSSKYFLYNMESIVKEKTTLESTSTVDIITPLSNGPIKTLEKDLTCVLIVDMPQSIPEPKISMNTCLIEPQVFVEPPKEILCSKQLNINPVKLNGANTLNNNTDMKINSNTPRSINPIPCLVSIPKTSPTDPKLPEEDLQVPSKKQILNPRIDKEKIMKADLVPVCLSDKLSNTCSLTEYSKNYIKIKTEQCVQTSWTNSSIKRVDPRMVRTETETVGNCAMKVQEAKIQFKSTSVGSNDDLSKQNQEKKVKIRLEEYRNRKCSVNGIDSQEECKQVPAALTPAILKCNVPEQSPVKMKSKAEVKDYARALDELTTSVCNHVEDNSKPKTSVVTNTKDPQVTNKPLVEPSTTDAPEPNASNIYNNLDCTNLTKPYKIKKRKKRFRNLYSSDHEEDAESRDLENDENVSKKSRANGDDHIRSERIKCHINLDKCGMFVRDKIQTYEINKNTFDNQLKLTLTSVKKPKPAFSEVLKNLDTVVSTETFSKTSKHSKSKSLSDRSDLTVPSSDTSSSDQSWTMKDKIPKVIIKRSASGYCAIFRDVTHNHMWQPQVVVTRLNEIQVKSLIQDSKLTP